MSPAGANSAQPHLSKVYLPETQNGGAVLSWLEKTETGATLRHSVLANGRWQQTKSVTSGDNWFINWADFPSVTPISNDLWAAHWLVKREGGQYAYDVAVALSMDQGQNWSDAVTPHTDNTATEHGFASLFEWDGATGVVWLDGRNMTSGGHDHANPTSAMTLRSARINETQNANHELIIDDRVCDCCQTDAAITTSGPVIVYRDRSEDEIRDIYVSRFANGIWSKGEAVAKDGWKIDGCPVNGPAIDAIDNVVSVAWFTLANGKPKVRFAQSTNAAESFNSSFDIDTDIPIGRVDIAQISKTSTAVSWVRRSELNNENHGELVVQLIQNGTVVGTPLVVADISLSRPSGFPQMMFVNNSLLFAWTHITTSSSVVKTALIPVTQLGSI